MVAQRGEVLPQMNAEQRGASLFANGMALPSSAFICGLALFPLIHCRKVNAAVHHMRTPNRNDLPQILILKSIFYAQRLRYISTVRKAHSGLVRIVGDSPKF